VKTVLATKPKPETAKPTKVEPLYSGLPWALLRAPLLPVEQYLRLGSEETLRVLLADDGVKAALAIGSTSLLSAIDRFQAGVLNKRDAERMHAKLRRYLIRMSTRPTPYGLFAGVALIPIADKTTLRIEQAFSRSRTRPDMGWLMDLVFRLEANPQIRKQLKWVANSAAFEHAGRIFADSKAASIRATAPAVRALSLARSPIPYDELSSELLRTTRNATSEKVERLLSQMFGQSFFFTDLRPPLTAGSPAEYVLEKLSALSESADSGGELKSLLEAVRNWDDAPLAKKPLKFWDLLRAVNLPADGSKPIPVQADLKLAASGSLAEAVSRAAGEAAELLLRLSAYPGGQGGLIAYRRAFLGRYGHHREMPLLELLDPQQGLGPVGSRGYANIGPSPAKAAERSRTLTDLACSCLHKHQKIVEFDSSLLGRLETCDPAARTAPLSLDINVQIGAASAADVDSGNFVLVIGPNLGGQSAGRNFGRFADLMGPDSDLFLSGISSAEAQHDPDAIDAEIVYLPSNRRMANVVIRPATRTHEVVSGVSAGVDSSRAIPLNELVVGVEDDRFYVRWTRENKRICFRTGHMLNYFNASPAIQFLSQVSHDGRMTFTSFDWGPVETFPFLPRLQKGQIVLRPAQWRIQKATCDFETMAAFEQWLHSWRAEWDVPRHVCLSAGDNRLVLDLEQEEEAAELRAELQKLHKEGAIVVQEVLPAFHEAWLGGPSGYHFNEFVLSFVLRPNSPPAAVEPKPPVTPVTVAAQDRNHAPGGEWLFVKLYCLQHLEDDLITDAILPFAEDIVHSGLADSWFFIRYSDPERHLRLRFHQAAQQSTGELFSKITAWTGQWLKHGTLTKTVFDTYEQEVERYGGTEGVHAAEELFAADSAASAILLKLLKSRAWPHDETTLFVLTIDDLLDALGLSETDRLAWYKKQTNARTSDVGTEFRKRKEILRAALNDPASFLSQLPCGREVIETLAGRRSALSRIGQQLTALKQDGVLSRSLDELCASFVHLHLNRLATTQSPTEHHVLGLLQRVRESLRSASAAKPKST
jgi:thiopeptide-type bacteriocin biosynthesis protein